MHVGIGDIVDVDRQDRARRQVDAVISRLAIAGGVDGRVQHRRRIKDVRVIGQREIVAEVKGCRDRIVGRVGPQRGIAAAHARRFDGDAIRQREIADQRVIAARADQRVIAALSDQHIGLAIALNPVIMARGAEVFDRLIVVALGRAAQTDAHAIGRIAVIGGVVAHAPHQRVVAQPALQRVIARSAGQFVVLIVADDVVVMERPDGVFELGEDVVADRGAAPDDLDRAGAVTAAGRAIGQIDGDRRRTAAVDDRVDACAAVQVILTAAADDRVIAAFAIDDVAIGAAIQQVIAVAPVEEIAAALTAEMVVRARADEPVDPVIGPDQVLDAVEGVAGCRAAAGHVGFQVHEQLERAFPAEIDGVAAGAAAEHVDPVLTHHQVVAIAAIQRIVSGAAKDGVIAIPAIERVGAIVAFGLVFQRRDGDRVVDVAAGQRIPAPDDQVIAVQPEDAVAPGAAIQRVVACIADEDAVKAAAAIGWGLGAAIIGGNHRSAGIDDVFDIRDGAQIDAICDHDDRVIAAIGFLAHDIIGGIDEIDVIPAIAGHAVIAAAPIQHIGAVIADQDVVMAAADAVLDVIFGLVGVMPGKDRHVVAVAVHAGKLARPQIEDRAGGRTGKVDRVFAASVMDHEADVVQHPRRGQLIAVLRAVEPIGVVAGVQIDDLIGPLAVFIHGREEPPDHRLDIRHQRGRGRPARIFAHIDAVEIGHDAVLLAVIGPGGVVQIVDLDAARPAVIVKAGMVQPEFMAEFMDETVKHIAADVGQVRFGVMETLADADIAVAGKGAAVVWLADFGADDAHPLCAAIPGLVIDNDEFQRRDGCPHVQRADGGGLVVGMVVQFGHVDDQRLLRDGGGQAAVQ